MAGLKIATFLGKAPKISPELLPNTAAQIAQNCKLYSGDLIPFPRPVYLATTKRTGVHRTLYGLRDPQNPEVLQPLSWLTDVSVVVASPNLRGERRFYYTGDGAPKVSDYALATSGPAPYPVDYYDLGLPLPANAQVLTTVAAAFMTGESVSFFRDLGNTATIITADPHGLRTGNIITVTGFTYLTGTYTQSGTTTIAITLTGHGLANGASVQLDFTSGTAIDGTYTITNVTPDTFDITVATAATTSGDVSLDLRGFNAAGVECTVIDDTAFSYFSPGFAINSQTYADGRVDLGGLTQARSYVFTWFTPWNEESIASRPSENLFIKEGVSVTVSDIPTSKPDGDNFVRGVRLYRTLASASGTEYFRLATLWFPTGLARVERTDNVSRVTLAQPHNLSLEDRFKISGCTDTSFNITGGVVVNVVDALTFEYAQTAADVTGANDTTGMLYHDVSENPPTSDARYWGDGGDYDFFDDFDSRNLFDILDSDEYDAPPTNMQGLTAIQNGVLAGFVGNTLYFSEPSRPHAWPAQYAQTIGAPIVALAALSGALLVLTKAYPYIVSVSDPAAGVSVSRIDVLYPCLSASSVVTMSYGVVWATHDGLAVYSPSSGAELVTRVLYNNDTWAADLDPTTIVAEYYGESYFAAHSTGSFVFEQDTQIGGFFVDTGPTFTASWYDPQTGKLYYVANDSGHIYEWDDLSQPALRMEWKSKTIITPNMINLGAARVIADYVPTTSLWEDITTTWETTTIRWDAPEALEFKLWADKELIYVGVVPDSGVFRLPTGYRSDTFEVGVESDIRVRAIHIAETPAGLREV